MKSKRATNQMNRYVDATVQEIVSRRCQGLAINIMDIGKVFSVARRAFLFNEDMETAVVAEYQRLAK